MASLLTRVGVSCATPSTGTLTLGAALGAVAPNLGLFFDWPTAGAVDGKTYRYLIIDSNGAVELGKGTYSAAGGTLTRSVKASSNSNNPLNLSGNSQVFIYADEDDIISITDDQTALFTTAEKQRASQNINAAQPPFGTRNRLINPSGALIQAGLANGTANNNYSGFDQWFYLGQNAMNPSQVSNAENGTPSMMRLTQANASASRMGLIQWLENAHCSDLRGAQVTLSARVRMSASTTLRYAVIEWTGTADAITKQVVNDFTNGTFTTGNFFASTTLTITGLGSIALAANTLADITPLTVTVGNSMNNLAVFFWTDSAQAQNVTLDVAKAQLEVGGFATAHAWRSYVDELALCQRYYTKSYDPGTAPGSATTVGMPFLGPGGATTSNLFLFVQFPVPMRIQAPTVTSYDSAGASGKCDKPTSGKTAAAAFNVGTRGAALGSSDATSAAQLQIHYTADARL